MPPQDPQAQRPRLSATKIRLLMTAERLFGTRGIDAVSLREIASEADAANTHAVQYHFGSKDGLMSAIFQYRILQMEQRRGMMLARAEEHGVLDHPSVLLRILCLPHLELAAEDGSYPYASFLIQFATRYWHSSPEGKWVESRRIAPNLQRLVEMIANASGDVHPELARSRPILCNIIFLTAIIRWTHVQRDEGEISLGEVVRDALRSAEAALQAGSSDVPMAEKLFEDWFSDTLPPADERGTLRLP
jgi:AcrR family transcriptional regulator